MWKSHKSENELCGCVEQEWKTRKECQFPYFLKTDGISAFCEYFKVCSIALEILNENVAMFNTFHVQPSALESGLVPLDLDVTPLDNSKTHKVLHTHTKVLTVMHQ